MAIDRKIVNSLFSSSPDKKGSRTSHRGSFHARFSMSDDKENIHKAIQWSSRCHGQRSTSWQHFILSFALVLVFFQEANANILITQDAVSDLLANASESQKSILNGLQRFCEKHDGEALFELKGTNGVHHLIGGGQGTRYFNKWWIESTQDKLTLRGNERPHYNVEIAESPNDKSWTWELVCTDKEIEAPEPLEIAAVAPSKPLVVKAPEPLEIAAVAPSKPLVVKAPEPLEISAGAPSKQLSHSDDEKHDALVAPEPKTVQILDTIKRSAGAVSTQIVLNKNTTQQIEKIYGEHEKGSFKTLKGKFKAVLNKEGQVMLGIDLKPDENLAWKIQVTKGLRKKKGKYLVLEWKLHFREWKFVLSYHNSRTLIPIATAMPKLDIFDGITMAEFQNAMNSMSPQENASVALKLQPQESWSIAPCQKHGKESRFDCRRRLAQRLTLASNDF